MSAKDPKTHFYFSYVFLLVFYGLAIISGQNDR